jgi:hypothetical protein
MYIEEILLYLTWPLLIFLSYCAIKWALRQSEKKTKAANGATKA